MQIYPNLSHIRFTGKQYETKYQRLLKLFDYSVASERQINTTDMLDSLFCCPKNLKLWPSLFTMKTILSLFFDTKYFLPCKFKIFTTQI